METLIRGALPFTSLTIGSSISSGNSFLICDISDLISWAILLVSSPAKSSAMTNDRDSLDSDLML
jgi:hypothetical protein